MADIKEQVAPPIGDKTDPANNTRKKDIFTDTPDNYMDSLKDVALAKGFDIGKQEEKELRGGFKMKQQFDNALGNMTDTIEVAVRKQESFYCEAFTMFLRRKE